MSDLSVFPENEYSRCPELEGAPESPGHLYGSWTSHPLLLCDECMIGAEEFIKWAAASRQRRSFWRRLIWGA